MDAGDENRKCGICSSLVLNRGVLDCCTHWFCFSCIDDWATVTNLCPLCKARFRFITCLPVGCGDGSNWESTESRSTLSKRDGGWHHDENSLPFSFPSYFIDEEAVSCLDGDACRVRAGLISCDGESALATDTSVACDVCDCWYHAGCVNFYPEQSSFCCPRCITPQGKAGDSYHAVKSNPPPSFDRMVSMVGSLPAEVPTYGNGRLLGSASVAIAVAEEGESAVSISMRRIPDVHQTRSQHMPLNTHADDGEMWSPIREAADVSQTYGAIWSPIRETVNASQTFEPMWSPIREPLKISQNYELWSPTREHADQFQNTELWSPTPEPANDFSMEDKPVCESVTSIEELFRAKSVEYNHGKSEISASNKHAVQQTGCNIQKPFTTMKAFESVGPERKMPMMALPTSWVAKGTDDLLNSVGIFKDKELLIDVDRLQEAVEQLKKGKRKVLQEDERRTDFKDLPQPPRKVSRKFTKKAEPLEGSGLAVNKKLSKQVCAESVGVEEIDGSQSNVVNNATISIDSSEEMILEQTDSQPIDTIPVKDASGVKDVLEPPCKVALKSIEKTDALLGRSLTANKMISQKVSLQDTSVERVDDSLNKVVNSMTISEDVSIEVPFKHTNAQPLDTLRDKDVSGVKGVPELPQKVTQKSIEMTDALEGRGVSVNKVMSKKGSLEDTHMGEIDDCPSKVVNNSKISIDSSKELLLEPVDTLLGKDVSSFKDVLDPSRKVTRKFIKTDTLEDRSSAANKVLSKKVSVKGIQVEEIDYCSSKVVKNSKMNKDSSKEVILERDDTHPIDAVPSKDMSYVEKQESLELTSPIDVMDIVSDLRDHLCKDGVEKSETQKGVRTRIIMHRESDVKDTIRPSLAERIRQQMRDSAGHGAGEELSKVEVSDDRFIAAFKAALARTHEKSKETKLTVSRQRKSLWLAKVLNRNIGGKGSRDSLTKKLYAGGTGRWDRDWDIAFWKERSAHLRRAEKEAEKEIDVTECTRSFARGDDKETDPEEADSIFNRLYIADTSLFPRNDDVQPLSAQVKKRKEDISEMSSKKAGKVSQFLLNKDTGCQGIKDNLGKNQPLHSLLAPKMFDNSSGALAVIKDRPIATSTSMLAEKGCGSSGIVKEGSCSGKCPTTAANTKAPGRETTRDFSPKVPTKSGAMKLQVSTTLKTQSNESESSKIDVKKDKRQWALEVLARKTGNSGNVSASAKAAGGSPSKEGQFSHLLQLPLDMRPLLPHNRHSKVPTAVRQVQLNRFVEQELSRAKLAVIQNSPECEEAVNRGKGREEELYKKSNSKGVYINLCVRALSQTETLLKVEQISESCVSAIVQKALEATGLVGSPESSPHHTQDDASTESMNKEAKVPAVEDSKGKKSCGDKWVENVLEIDNLDIYGDFEFDIGNDFEGTQFLDKSPSKFEVPTSTHELDSKTNKTNKMMVLLTTGSCQSNTPAKVHPNCAVDIQLSQHGVQDPDVKATQSSEFEPTTGEAHCSTGEINDLYDGLDVKSFNPEPTTTVNVVAMKDDSHSTAVQPDMHLACENLNMNPGTSAILERNIESSTYVEGQQQSAQAGISDMDDWIIASKFADLDRRIENIRQNTSPVVNGGTDVPWKPKVRDDMVSTKRNELRNSVQKQVEIYVNQHLKPLYKSGVIKADQFRYAVSKTAIKVMEHHGSASSADFLITEGSKVKKLADQYLQAFSKRKVSE